MNDLNVTLKSNIILDDKNESIDYESICVIQIDKYIRTNISLIKKNNNMFF